MKISPFSSNKPSKYAKISLETRIKLVDLVLKDSKTISFAARKLNIKQSTAKMIIKRYKSDNTFFETRSSRIVRINSIIPNQKRKEENQSFQMERTVERNNNIYQNIEWITPFFRPNLSLPIDSIFYYTNRFQGSIIEFMPNLVPFQYNFYSIQ